MKTILITGGATGLGNELAKLYVQNGDQVILLGRNEERLNKAQEELGTSCIATVSADLTNYQGLTQKMDNLLSFHSVDVLVNNAGMGHFGPLTSYTKEMIDEVIDTNVKGTKGGNIVSDKRYSEMSTYEIQQEISVLNDKARKAEQLGMINEYAVLERKTNPFMSQVNLRSEDLLKV